MDFIIECRTEKTVEFCEQVARNPPQLHAPGGALTWVT
jgi:hypothetical protein